MSILETMRNWLAECPYLDEFSGGHIDWTDSTAMEYGIMPTGSVTIRTEEDVLGNKTVYKQNEDVIFRFFADVTVSNKMWYALYTSKDRKSVV